MKKLRHSLRYEITLGEQNSGEVITVPDMAMSVQEIMHRFASGRPLNFKELEYSEDEYRPTGLDLTEQAEMLEATRERTQTLQKEIEGKRLLRSEAAKQRRKKHQAMLEKYDRDMENDPNVTYKPKDEA